MFAPNPQRDIPNRSRAGVAPERVRKILQQTPGKSAQTASQYNAAPTRSVRTNVVNNQTIDQTFRTRYNTTPSDQQKAASQKQPATTNSNRQIGYVQTKSGIVSTANTRAPRKSVVTRTQGTAAKALTQARATAVSIPVLLVGINLWLFLQLPLAILNIVFLGIAAAVQEAIDIVNKPDDMLESAVSWAFRTASEIFDMFGFQLMSLIELEPGALVLITTLLIMTIGYLTTFTAMFLYTIRFFNPIGGRGATAKLIALIVVLLGYFMPFLNLFPWFVFYVLAMWRNPR